MDEIMEKQKRHGSKRHLTEKDKGEKPAANRCSRVNNKKGDRRRSRRNEQGRERTLRADRLRSRLALSRSGVHLSFSLASGATAADAYCDNCKARM
jgi:hypothetical protein